MAQRNAVQIEGLRDLRRDLSKIGKEAAKELRVELRDAAGMVAGQANILAPRRTGALAASYRPGTSGAKAFVRSRLPYAGVHEYGGTIKPRGVPIKIRASAPIRRGLTFKRAEVLEKLAGGIQRVAKKNGFN